jgi:hypothetical protein
MDFRDVVRDGRQGVIIYTVIPPPADAARPAVEACVDCLQALLEDVPVHAINLPEVRDETTRPGPRTSAFVPKLAPRLFADAIRRRLHDTSLDVIVDRGIVYTNWANQTVWLRKTWSGYGVRNLILVGGESSQKRYAGPPVSEAARRISRELKPQCNYFLGGITIPTRRNEPERLVGKAESGIEFFTSQVLYEAENVCRLLREYHQQCLETRLEPKRIFLSFAPVSSARDVEFLKWLGVEIPRDVERMVLDGWIGTAWRSIRVAERILRDILAFVRDEEIGVPLGINVEHVMKHNFEVSRDMALALREIYEKQPQPGLSRG